MMTIGFGHGSACRARLVNDGGRRKTKREEGVAAGYSGTPLVKKLGIKSGMVIRVVNAPGDYAALVDPLPEGVVVSSKAVAELDLVHVFATSRSELFEALATYQSRIKQTGTIWVSWPKK